MSEKDSDEPQIKVEDSQEITRDELTLNHLGYKQEFKRELNLWSCFSVAFSVIGLLPSIAAVLFYGIGYIGIPGLSWGWLIACTGIIAVSLSMAELCSSMPTSGGLYYSGAVLAPKKYKALAAWTIGWSNWLAQITWSPSVNYSLVSLIFSVATMNNENLVFKKWHTYLLSVAFMLFDAVLASLPTKYMSWVNQFASVLNIISYAITFITLLAGNKRSSPKFNTNSQVWSQFTNQTDWPDGIAFLMSFLAAIWCIAGFDGAFHLSEECSNAAVAAPNAIILTTATASLFGWVLMLVIAYTITDIGTVIDSDVGLPFATYCDQVVGTKAATGILSITAVCLFLMGQACSVTAGRVAYAYSRDGCLPYSSFFAKVNERTKTPVRAIWGNTVLGILILLLCFNTTAISAIFSLGGTAAYVAFSIPILLKLTTGRSRFKPGPWNLGKFSDPIAIYACSFVALMIPILSFPAGRGADLSAESMNWTSLVYFGPILVALVWYGVDARKWFKGPKVDPRHFNY